MATEQGLPIVHVQQLLPQPAPARPLDQALNFPDQAPWLRAVFVASIDGATTVRGRVGMLGNETDKQLFAMHRAIADVLLVGAGTARAEEYGPAEADPRWTHLRDGRPATAPLALVSHELSFDFNAPLFTDAPSDARTVIITRASAPADRLAQARSAAEVIVAGEESVDLVAAVAELRTRGYDRISCEGGPRLFADLLRLGLVDELCLTRAPFLVGGSEFGLMRGDEPTHPCAMQLQALHASDDDYLYATYRPQVR